MLIRRRERFTETDRTIDDLLMERGWLVRQMIDCRIGSEEHSRAMAEINKIDDLICARQLELTNEDNNRTNAVVESVLATYVEGI